MYRERYSLTEEEKIELLNSYKASHLTRFITRTRKKSLYVLPYIITTITDIQIEQRVNILL